MVCVGRGGRGVRTRALSVGDELSMMSAHLTRPVAGNCWRIFSTRSTIRTLISYTLEDETFFS